MPNSSPEIIVIGTDGEPSDSAISALARLLLAVVDQEQAETTPPLNDRSRPGANGTASVKSQESLEHEC
jgi:hypothetical protein